MELEVNILIAVFAGLAGGFIDAVVGGGGLIQIPALLLLLPNAPLATIFGTNKFASIAGTTAAAHRFSKEISFKDRVIWLGSTAAFVASFVGAKLVSLIDRESCQPFIIAMLAIVLFYTLFKDYLPKRNENAALSPKLLRNSLIAISAFLGFYDGIFGPGTGSFLLFSFNAFLGFSLLKAAAYAKVVNVATNLSALLFFLYSGNVLLTYALPMAISCVIGAKIGSSMAIKKGDGFIRVMFVVVVTAMIFKLLFS